MVGLLLRWHLTIQRLYILFARERIPENNEDGGE